jgi:hypothetical protein
LKLFERDSAQRFIDLIGQAETFTPAETTVMGINAPNLDLNRTFTVRRKVAKRSECWFLVSQAAEAKYRSALPRSPQVEVIPARKKQRPEEPLPTTIDQDARRTESLDVSAGFPPAVAENNDDANADPVTGTQPNVGVSRVSLCWTPEEYLKMTSAVGHTHKKIWGKGYKIDWVAVALLVSGRTKMQCHHKWREVLDERVNGQQTTTAS